MRCTSVQLIGRYVQVTRRHYNIVKYYYTVLSMYGIDCIVYLSIIIHNS